MGSVLSTVTSLAAKVLYYVLHPGWLHLWPPIQLLYLICKRSVLREENLKVPVTLPPSTSVIREGATSADVRTFEGSGNNREKPTMGMTGCPFARNCLPPLPEADVSKGPDPAVVSQKLLARPNGVTKTRPLANLLAGGWLQFMIHDWFEVQKDMDAAPVEFPLPGGDVMPLQPATVSPEDRTHINNHDHWWSGAQLYGTTPERNRELRTGEGGRMLLNPDGSYLALDAAGVELVGFNKNLWSGLQLLHYLFVKEHNAVCDMLAANHPDWGDDRLFATARKIITALIARIHTVDWTTAIVQHPTGRAVQYVLWYGFLGTFLGRKLLGLARLLQPLGSLGSLLVGIPGSKTAFANNQPFGWTEEFIAVYRMHALLPDKVTLRSSSTGKETGSVDFGDIILDRGTAVNTTMPLADLFTTLGMGEAARLELRNYPTALLRLKTPQLKLMDAKDGKNGAGKPERFLDIGAVDVWRGREARLPLWNDFREALHMPRYTDVKRLMPTDKGSREALTEVYGSDLNKVDVMIGLLAEPQLPGFIFGEGIYSIFTLQTQRRMESDRFLTQDFTPEAYTPEGMEWIEKTSMSDILRRHIPETANWLQPDDNAFIPWGSTHKRKLHEKVLWDVIFPWPVYGWLKGMGFNW